MRLRLLGLLLCLPLSAAELKLPESPVEPYTLIRMQVIDAEAIEDVLVQTVTKRGDSYEILYVDIETSITAGTYVFTGPPGVYSIRIRCKGVAPLVGRLEVRGSSPFPPTPVPPGPTPPTPTPVAGKRSMIILYESADATTDQARLFNRLQTDASISSYLTSKGHRIWIFDDDLPQAATWISKVTQRPGAVLIDQDSSSVLYSGDLPATADGVVELIKQHGG